MSRAKGLREDDFCPENQGRLSEGASGNLRTGRRNHLLRKNDGQLQGFCLFVCVCFRRVSGSLSCVPCLFGLIIFFLLSRQEISGWYYLLGEDLGRTKHLKVARRRLQPLRGVCKPLEAP